MLEIQVGDTRSVIDHLILSRQRRRHTIAELSGIRELVHTSDRAAAAG